MQHTASTPASTTGSTAKSPWEERKQTLLDFWAKCNNDWIFNFSGLLAYTLLMSIFPLFLVLLAIAGLTLNQLSPEALTSLANSLKTALPGQTGGAIVDAALGQFTKEHGLALRAWPPARALQRLTSLHHHRE